jgi:hypothetical protein
VIEASPGEDIELPAKPIALDAETSELFLLIAQSHRSGLQRCGRCPS